MFDLFFIMMKSILYCFLKGIKGDAGTKGALGRFGARGPVGQKVNKNLL